MSNDSAEKPITILAVDDESENAELVRRALRARPDVQTITASSAMEALAILQSRRVDLMVLDYRMPTMTGVELLGRATIMNARPPSIMLTAYPEEADVLAAESQGLVQCVLAKPWQPADLVMAIDVALAMRARRSR